jgi:hypothetical protein
MKNLKENKGFTQADIVISIVILMLFTTLVSSLFYNSYVSSMKSKRHSEATIYLTKIFESIELISYDNLENEIINVINKIDENKLSGTIVESGNTQISLSTPYKAEVEIKKYNEMDGNTDKEDLVKLITVTIKYKSKNDKEETITAKRLKTKEIIYEDSLEIVPNLYEGMIPISTETQATNEYATNWFDYSKEKAAKIMLQDGNYNTDTGEITNEGSSFVYVPRFAYKINSDESIDIKFLNTDDTCKDGSSTDINFESDNIENDKYYLPSCFSQNNIQVAGIWVGEYLSKRNTEGNNGEQIYIGKKDEANNYKYWTNLTDEEKQEKCNYLISDGANYGLKGDETAKIAGTNINNMLEKLKKSNYKYIAEAIQENETDYEGSFRVIIY